MQSITVYFDCELRFTLGAEAQRSSAEQNQLLTAGVANTRHKAPDRNALQTICCLL